jgi:hypothetical protein
VELDARLVKSGAAGFWPVVGSVVAARRGRKDASHQMKIVWRDHLPREFVFWHVSTSALHVCRPGPVARTGRDPIQDQRDASGAAGVAAQRAAWAYACWSNFTL